MKKILLLSSMIALFVFNALANVTLPSLFSDHMVLQRDQLIPVWGWAAPGEKVTVSLNGKTKSTSAGKNGRWMIKLDKTAAGGPYQLIVKGKNTLTLNNVLVGEVWFCSGQSNMEMPIAGWGLINNYEKEIADANYPQIRQFDVENTISSKALDSAKGRWMECKSANAGNFIATGYFFARELHKKLSVPVGIINCSWGGSMIETWISRDALENDEEFKSVVRAIPADIIDARAKQKSDSLKSAITKLQSDIPEKAESDKYKNADIDDSRWPAATLPGSWEGASKTLSELHGVIWFRKKITLNEEQARQGGIVALGRGDVANEIYLNGIKLAEAKSNMSDVTSFAVYPGMLKAGENVIATRVEFYGGPWGGIGGMVADKYLKFDSVKVPLNGEWKYKVGSVYQNANPNAYPTLLYNAMVHPVIPYAIKGALWYQGETNAGRAYQYRKAFPLMISDWRNKWNQGDFPFYFVQLASFDADGGNSEKGSSWAELREAQAMTLNVSNTGMAVTTDIGDARDIHPKNKQDVGKRLALLALKNTYGNQVVDGGPVYSSMKKEGNKVIISFSRADDGLVVKDKYGYIKGFEVAGADKKFYWANAVIEGNKVVVYSEKVTDPQAVHYAWSDNTEEANLFNKAGLPAAPFRTDTWTGITEKARFTVE